MEFWIHKFLIVYMWSSHFYSYPKREKTPTPLPSPSFLSFCSSSHCFASFSRTIPPVPLSSWPAPCMQVYYSSRHITFSATPERDWHFEGLFFYLTFHWPVWDILLARQGQNEYLFKGFYCNICPFVSVSIYSMNQTEQFPPICKPVLLNVMWTVLSPWRWRQ